MALQLLWEGHSARLCLRLACCTADVCFCATRLLSCLCLSKLSCTQLLPAGICHLPVALWRCIVTALVTTLLVLTLLLLTVFTSLLALVPLTATATTSPLSPLSRLVGGRRRQPVQPRDELRRQCVHKLVGAAPARLQLARADEHWLPLHRLEHRAIPLAHLGASQQHPATR
eukprot:1047535-Prymnesium_polylepis.1